MSRALNCPNCGAPLGVKDVCEYCGTHFIDFTMDTEEPFYIKIRHNEAVTTANYLADTRDPIKWWGNNVEKVLAWMPLPEHYKR